VLTALIVEDNEWNRKLLRDILEEKFEVLEAESAEAASTILTQQRPDLIFMDLQLPGMDGLTYVRQLKSMPETAAIPVVAVSAHAMQDNIDQALASGCVEYVTKPITEDFSSFVERMAGFVRNSSPDAVQEEY
jgi:two-component system, cell cycle response regulator DivK